MDDQLMMFLVQNFDFAPSEWKVLMALISLANYRNIVLRTAEQMAEIVGMTRTNYTRALTALHKKGLVCKIPGQGRVVYQMINPSLVLKTSPSEISQLFKRWDEELKSDRNANAREGADMIACLPAERKAARKLVIAARDVTR